MPTNNFLTCPSGCDVALNLPAIDVEQDCTKVALNYSQVEDIIILPSGVAPPTGWDDAAEWAAVIDNTNNNNTKAKHLVVEGGVAAPEKSTVTFPKRKEAIKNRRYTLTATTRLLSDEMYEFMRALQCGDAAGVRIFYANNAHIFGGDDGIQLRSIDVDMPLSEGAEDYELATLVFTWDADGDPDRNTTPF